MDNRNLDKVNLHSHTQFCDGHCSMQEMIMAAQEAGFSKWGFTPHGPISVESPCNMKPDDVEKYSAEVERLRKLFPRIEILKGMEVDYIDEEHGPSSQIVKDYDLDYVIGSVHFIPDQHGIYRDIDGSPERFKKYLHDYFNNDIEYVITTFWKQTISMIKAGGMDIVGHIDKIALNASFVDPEIENNSEYRELMQAAINAAIKNGIAIEINTKHHAKYGRFFPNPRYWKEILKAGVKMPINSDTHYAEMVSTGIEEAQKLKEYYLREELKNNKNALFLY